MAICRCTLILDKDRNRLHCVFSWLKKKPGIKPGFLTPAREKVYLLAVLTLDWKRALQDELLNLAHGPNSMCLEVTFSIGEHLLPDLLFQFAELYPGYKVDSRNIQSHLATGLADLPDGKCTGSS